ncbi:hypothetical protein DID74_01445 [Candidatus Marinamargulisbacteria bacterium SCGC AG-333-B06]|nr:hypothetical protein DID74_01445 [Candidatus Marinamargulisbacteria bacterium SCGC AG-333-B06]
MPISNSTPPAFRHRLYGGAYPYSGLNLLSQVNMSAIKDETINIGFNNNVRNIVERYNNLLLIDSLPYQSITIELDMDGCFLNGDSGYFKNQKKNFSYATPVNQSLFTMLNYMKQLAHNKAASFQVNICSTANLKTLNQNKALNVIINHLITLNDHKPVFQCTMFGEITFYLKNKDNHIEISKIGSEHVQNLTNLFFKLGSSKPFGSPNSSKGLNKPAAIQFNLGLRLASQYLKTHFFLSYDVKDIEHGLITQSNQHRFYSTLESHQETLQHYIHTNLLKASQTVVFVDNDPLYSLGGIKQNKSIECNPNLANILAIVPFSTLVDTQGTILPCIVDEEGYFGDDNVIKKQDCHRYDQSLYDLNQTMPKMLLKYSHYYKPVRSIGPQHIFCDPQQVANALYISIQKQYLPTLSYIASPLHIHPYPQ